LAVDREQIRALVSKVVADLRGRGLIDSDPPAAPPSSGPPPGSPAPRSSTAAPGSSTAAAARTAAHTTAHAATQTAAQSVRPAPDADRRVAIGSDHGGFALKKTLIELLRELRYEVEDCGTYSQDSCDYPDFAIKVGEAVRGGLCALGIMIDGAGIGSAMALNKMAGIRAATVHSEATAINSREHNDANVLVLGSGQMHSGHARRITRIWLATPHAGGRHARRVDKINALDEGRA
jgi:ribose 5-phosphate isomerase B